MMGSCLINYICFLLLYTVFIWQINVMLCYVMLCYVILCYVMLCYVIQTNFIVLGFILALLRVLMFSVFCGTRQP